MWNRLIWVPSGGNNRSSAVNGQFKIQKQVNKTDNNATDVVKRHYFRIRNVKKIIAHIAICVAVLTAILPGQSVSELHKVPALIEHYHHHRESNGHEQLTFAEFLMMHYNQASSHKNEEDHEDLPLFHTCCVNVLFVSETTEIKIFVDKDEQSLKPTEVTNEYNYSIHHTIFQPPRNQHLYC
jgi:hypothetical protein